MPVYYISINLLLSQSVLLVLLLIHLFSPSLLVSAQKLLLNSLSSSAPWSTATYTGNLFYSDVNIIYTLPSSPSQPLTCNAGCWIMYGGNAYGANDIWLSGSSTGPIQGASWDIASGHMSSVVNSTKPLSSYTPTIDAAGGYDRTNSRYYRAFGKQLSSNRQLIYNNEVWVSDVSGLIWTSLQITTPSEAPPARSNAGLAVASDGSIFILNGETSNGQAAPYFLADVWKGIISSDYSNIAFTLQTSAANYGAREDAAVFMDRHSALLRGGDLLYLISGTVISATSGNYIPMNDVWVSSDQAQSWQLVTLSGQFPSRGGASLVITSEDEGFTQRALILFGGYGGQGPDIYYNDGHILY